MRAKTVFNRFLQTGEFEGLRSRDRDAMRESPIKKGFLSVVVAERAFRNSSEEIVLNS
jgi:hypothetical protein